MCQIRSSNYLLGVLLCGALLLVQSRTVDRFNHIDLDELGVYNDNIDDIDDISSSFESEYDYDSDEADLDDIITARYNSWWPGNRGE